MDLVYIKDAGSKGRGLYARLPFKAGEFVLEFVGDIKPLGYASVMSLQIDDDLAIESTVDIDNLNHSCDPNCKVEIGVDFSSYDHYVYLSALRDIAADEELTFNYNSTEYDMVTQGCNFCCQCGTLYCLGEVHGFRHLDAEQKLGVRELLVPYLYKQLQ